MDSKKFLLTFLVILLFLLPFFGRSDERLNSSIYSQQQQKTAVTKKTVRKTQTSQAQKTQVIYQDDQQIDFNELDVEDQQSSADVEISPRATNRFKNKQVKKENFNREIKDALSSL